jgi:hypothetical protein
VLPALPFGGNELELERNVESSSFTLTTDNELVVRSEQRQLPVVMQEEIDDLGRRVHEHRLRLIEPTPTCRSLIRVTAHTGETLIFRK